MVDCIWYLFNINQLLYKESYTMRTSSNGSKILIGGSGDDTLTGDQGNDLLIGGSGDDTLSGDQGSDLLIGGSGSDNLSGGDGSDFLVGGSGDDVLDAGDGSHDVALGGSGNDTFIYDISSHLKAANNTYYVGGSGQDTILFRMTQTEADNYKNSIEEAFYNQLNSNNSGDLNLTFGESNLYLRDFENIKFQIVGPVANNDEATITENHPGLDIQVLANDTNPANSSALIVTDVDTATYNTKGTVTINPDYTINYNPGTAFDYLSVGDSASDTFKYIISDSQGNTSSALVNVIIQGTNDLPIATPDDGFITNEDSALVIDANQLLANDHDLDLNDSITVVNVDASSAKGAAITFDGTNIVYNPENVFQDLKEGEMATDTFNYQISDNQGGQATASVTVKVTGVNDAPVAKNLALNGAEDTAIQGTLLSTDIEGDSLSYSVVENPSHGSVSLNGDGTFTYTPNENYNGSDYFTYQTSDGALESNIAKVSIVINPVNDAPVAFDVSTTGLEDSAGINGLFQATDVEGDSLTYNIVDNPAHGSITVNSNGTFTYIPNENFNGTDTFAYQVSDGEAVSNVATATINVQPVNDVPVITSPNAVSVAENTTSPVLQVTATDVDNDAITYSIAGGADSNQFTIDPNTGWLNFVNSPNFEQPQDSNSDNQYEVTVRASDGNAYVDQPVTVTVQNVIESPTPLFSEGDDAVNFDHITAGEYNDSPYNSLAGDDTVNLPNSLAEADEAGYGHSSGTLNTFAGGLGNDTIGITADAENPSTNIIGDKSTLTGETGGDDVIQGGSNNDVIYGDAVHMEGESSGDSSSEEDDDSDATETNSDSTDTGSEAPGGGYDEDPSDSSGDDTSSGTETVEDGITPSVGGQDIIYGNAGDDIIYGDAATISDSNEASDTIFGGPGNDTLYGGAGGNVSDTFVFQGGDINAASPETDIIKDFTIGQITSDSTTGVSVGGDVLRLDQVLENLPEVSGSSLSNYLQLTDTTDGTLNINIDVSGEGNFSSPNHTILLEGALSSASLPLVDQASAIQTLLDNGNLEVIP